MNNTDTKRNGLGGRVKDARERRGWSKEHAARQAGISTITWKRVEDGERVQDVKLALILRVLGMDVTETPDDVRDYPNVIDVSRLSDHDRRLLLAQWREMTRGDDS